MEFGIALPQTFPPAAGPLDVTRIARFVPRAEALGYDALWAIEQVIGTVPCLEALALLAHVSALTKRVRLGAAVLIVAQRAPLELAKSLATIDVLSEGRLIVGVGLGGASRFDEAYGLGARPGRSAGAVRLDRMLRNLEIMRALWTEERATLGNLSGVPMEPKPVQKPHPPIWFGGHADTALQRAVRIGDGFIGAGSTKMETFLEEVAKVRSFLGDRTDFPIAKRLYLSCDDNLPGMREWFGAFYRRPELADEVAVWGSPQRVIEAIARLRDAGVTHVLLHPVTDEESHLERLAAEVMPQFR